MKLNRILLVIILSAINCFGQETKWTRIEFEKTVSVSVPDGFLVDLKTQYVNQKYRVFCSNGDFWFSLNVYKSSNPKEYVNGYRRESNDSDRVVSDEFVARRLIFEQVAENSNTILIGTKKYYYDFNIRIPNLGDSKLLALKFINSIKINDKTLFPQDVPPVEIGTVLVDTKLKPSTEVLAAYNRPFEETDDFTKLESIDEIIEIQKSEKRRFSRQIIPVDNHFGIINDRIGKIVLKGKIVAAVLVKADGSIGEIKAFYTTDEKTAKAFIKEGRRTKFIPAQIDGKNIDSIYIREIDLDSLFDKNVIGQ